MAQPATNAAVTLRADHDKHYATQLPSQSKCDVVSRPHTTAESVTMIIVDAVTVRVHSHASCKLMHRLLHTEDRKSAAKHAKRTAETKVDLKGRRQQAAKQNDGANSKGIELVVVLDSAGRQGWQEWNS